MAISLNSAHTLISTIKSRLETNFSFNISLEGLDDTIEDLEYVLDVDYDTLRQLNKETLLWKDYLCDLASNLNIYLDRYKNTKEILDYLLFLAKKDKPLFLTIAPKYKIATRDFEAALMETTNKKIEIDLIVKNITTIIKFLESYQRYMKFHYYRTSRLIKKSYNRYKNTEDIT